MITPSQHYEKTKCLSFQSLFGVSKCFSFAAILSAFYSSTNDVLRQHGDQLKPKALPKQVGENCGWCDQLFDRIQDLILHSIPVAPKKDKTDTVTLHSWLSSCRKEKNERHFFFSSSAFRRWFDIPCPMACQWHMSEIWSQPRIHPNLANRTGATAVVVAPNSKSGCASKTRLPSTAMV